MIPAGIQCIHEGTREVEPLILVDGHDGRAFATSDDETSSAVESDRSREIGGEGRERRSDLLTDVEVPYGDGSGVVQRRRQSPALIKRDGDGISTDADDYGLRGLEVDDLDALDTYGHDPVAGDEVAVVTTAAG